MRPEKEFLDLRERVTKIEARHGRHEKDLLEMQARQTRQEKHLLEVQGELRAFGRKADDFHKRLELQQQKIMEAIRGLK